jgi:hypothetical protein
MGKIIDTALLAENGACTEGLRDFMEATNDTGTVKLTEEWARENDHLDWSWFAAEVLERPHYREYLRLRRELIDKYTTEDPNGFRLYKTPYYKERAALVARLFLSE